MTYTKNSLEIPYENFIFQPDQINIEERKKMTTLFVLIIVLVCCILVLIYVSEEHKKVSGNKLR